MLTKTEEAKTLNKVQLLTEIKNLEWFKKKWKCEFNQFSEGITFNIHLRY